MYVAFLEWYIYLLAYLHMFYMQHWQDNSLIKDINVLFLIYFKVSVSCGIPDFRSRDGIYARLAVEFPDLPDPQAMFDIKYFKNDPRPFFKFAKVFIMFINFLFIKIVIYEIFLIAVSSLEIFHHSVLSVVWEFTIMLCSESDIWAHSQWKTILSIFPHLKNYKNFQISCAKKCRDPCHVGKYKIFTTINHG